MSISQAAQLVRAQGRGNDSQLMHVTPSEVNALQGLAQAHGGSLTINPQTGLPEAGFLESVLPTIAGIGIGFATGNPFLGAAVAGGIGYGVSGSLEQGLLSGIGAFGGASALSSLAATGAGAAGAVGATGSTMAGTTAGSAVATDIGAMAAMDAGLAGGNVAAQQAAQQAVSQGAASQLINSQALNALPAGGKFSALGQGFSNLMSDPSGTFSAMGGLKGQGANLAMAGAPLLGGLMGSGSSIEEPPPQESYIRPSVYDPQTQRYTSLEPVLSSDWGTRSFQDYARSQGYPYAEGGDVQQRYTRPTRTVDPAVTEYNQMLMNQARQEYPQQQQMTGLAQLTPSLMRPAAPAAVAPASVPSVSVDSSREFMYNPATQSFTKNPNYVPPAPKPGIMDAYAEYAGLNSFLGLPSDMRISREGSGSQGSSNTSGAKAGGVIKKMAAGGITDVPKFQAGGEMESDAFVVPADVVSALGNGSTDAGVDLLNQYLGMAMPIEGEGDGLSDDIPASIDGEQPARVANGEVYIPADAVAMLGDGDPERGAAKLYSMMDKIREAAHGKKQQQREVQPEKVMPA